MPDVVPVKFPISRFVPISKVDASLHQGWGTMVAEMPDKSGEIFDYKTSKPLFQQWTSDFESVTKGKSKGNVREMHQLSAVGKIINMDFDDAAMKIDIGVEIVDKDAWLKVEEGVY